MNKTKILWIAGGIGIIIMIFIFGMIYGISNQGKRMTECKKLINAIDRKNNSEQWLNYWSGEFSKSSSQIDESILNIKGE